MANNRIDLAPGIWIDVVDDTLHIDAPAVCAAHGVDVTDENIAVLTAAAEKFARRIHAAFDEEP